MKSFFIILFFLASCTASKKNVSIAKSHTDSIVSQVKKETLSKTTDSISNKKENSSYTKETDITYAPVEIDSGTAPASLIKIKSKTPGKEIVLIPSIKIKEIGTAEKIDDTTCKKKTVAPSNKKQKPT